MDNEEFKSTDVLIDDLNLSTRIANSLIKKKIYTVSDLEKITEKQLFNIKGIGKKAIQYIKDEYKLIFQKELFDPIRVKKLIAKLSEDFEKKPSRLKIFEKTNRNYTPLKKIDYRRKRFLNLAEKQRILDIKKLYDKYESLQKVGNEFKLTRERIRQLLNTGNKFGLFKYNTVKKIKFENIVIEVTKDKLIEEIFKDRTIQEICSYFSINKAQYFKLIKFYKIDTFGKRTGAKRIKYITKYNEIVELLGHHPSTTELNSRPEWTNVWHGIDWYWGNMEKFRRENNIQKPIQKIHINTKKFWDTEILRKKAQKQYKIQNILNFIKGKNEVKQADIKNVYKYKTSTLNLYIKEMTNRNLIKKRREGINIFYSLK